MDIVSTLAALREHVRQARKSGKRVAFVPTMGNLHEGHLSLVDEAKKQADYVVSSIFVNPLQFGANEDLDRYPRTLAADARALQSRACNLLFTPGIDDMYPLGLAAETKVHVPDLGQLHCGASRPGHFDGVSTVVTKLFNMVQPDLAVFGQKDFQQLAIIRKLTRDLCLPIDIVAGAISREENGLARSSRNGFLSQENKHIASALYASLRTARTEIEQGETDFVAIASKAQEALALAGFRNDYFNIANAETLAMANPSDKNLVILAAAFLGDTRLIDNLTVSK